MSIVKSSQLEKTQPSCNSASVNSMIRLSVAPGISHLSQELIDEIIDHLQVFCLQDDDLVERNAVFLKTSALISRIFRSRSQKHLFTHIGVYMTGSNMAQSKLGRLNNVFSTNPRLASHVRIFTVRIRETDDLCSRSFDHPHFVACLGHILQSGNTHPSPCGLQIYLTTNDVYGHRSEAIALPWRLESKTYFIPSVVTSRLTSIEIRDLLNVPIALFDTCSNLRKLNIFGIRLVPFEESERIPIEKRPLIRELLVADSEDLICRTGLRFDALERLVFQGSLNDMDMDTMQHIFNSNPSCLGYLNFFLPASLACDNINTHLYPEIGVDFSRMPNLRELKFQAMPSPHSWWPNDDETETDMITSLAEFLATFPTEHKLKRIGIFFDCCMDLRDDEIPDQRPQDVEAHLRTGNWAAFDLTIVRMASAIKHPLELSIMIEYFVEQDRKMTLAAVEKARTKDKGTLEDWGVKYLPRTSESPNVVLEVIKMYDDDWDIFRREESGVGSKSVLQVGE